LKEKVMGKIDDACKEVVDHVDGAIACGVVDIETGTLLGIHNISKNTGALNEVVAAATKDLFRGSKIGRIEQLVRSHRGVPENREHHFREVHVTSERNFQFAKAVKEGKSIIVLVTKKSTNIGVGWSQLKSIIPMVESLVP
jgi:hypothetical protein